MHDRRPRLPRPRPARLLCAGLWPGLAALLLGLAGSATAQPTNLDVYLDLAHSCLSAAPDTADAFFLDPADTMPYLATSLAAHWQQANLTVFLGDSAAAPAPLPQLTYTIDEAQVTYTRIEHGHVRRTIHLALRYTFTAADGRLLHTAPCHEAFTDVLDRDALDAVESPAFPETQGERPPPRWPRRYLEPIVLTAATAVAVFLFFSLRSDRADDGV